MKRNDRRVALVTGGARGLGLKISEELARVGMAIAAIDVRQEELEVNLSSLGKKYGVATLPICANVCDERSVEAAVKEIVDKLGPVYALVNNAGIRKVSPIWSTATELWDQTISVNLRGHFICTREVLRQGMRKRNEGRIVFISSIAGKRGTRDSSAYSATKWGILGLSHSVAQDLKDTSIRVSAITPGRTDTPMARESEKWDPDIGWLNPTAIAGAVVFCIQQDSSTVIPELHLHHAAEL